MTQAEGHTKTNKRLFDSYAIGIFLPKTRITPLFVLFIQAFLSLHWECSGSVVVCLARDREAAGTNLTGVTASCSLSKTRLSLLSTGSIQEDPSLFN